MIDGLIDNAKDANKAGLVESCGPQALPYHGDARMIERGPGETDEAWRLRLIDAWDHWGTSGTKAGLQDILRFYVDEVGLYVFDVVNDDWTGGATGTWDDANGDNWSRLWIVIEEPHRWDRPVVGTGVVVGPDTLVGITMTGTELSQIRRVFRKYRPAHVTGGEVVVLLDDPPSTADDMRLDHSVAGTDAVFMPLQVQMVGYRGAIVGSALSVGTDFR